MISRLWRKRLHRPEALRLVLRDALGARGPVLPARVHLDEAAAWIARAQDATPDAGVAGGYSFEDGWIASYPETTGYIIPTLLVYAEHAAAPRYRERALAMARWELTVQLPSGGFPGHFVDRAHPPVVFNTGQVIFGLLAAGDAAGDAAFLEAARRAGDWLLGIQDEDGAWRRFDYLDAVHSYNTRTAWALVELGRRAPDERFVEAARRNLDWACGQQHADGWFAHAGFAPGDPPYLHTIAYTTQGLLEAGLTLKEPRYVEAAERALRILLRHRRADGWLPGAFGEGWAPARRYSCLTGSAQTSTQWLRLHTVTGEAAFLDAARSVNDHLKSLQDCRTRHLHVRGAVKGSHPIWGGYLFGTFPNWAAKFFMDALLLEEAVLGGQPQCIRCW